MSVFSQKLRKTVRKAAAVSLTALTALSCAVSLPVLTSPSAGAAGSVLSNEKRGVIYANSRSDFRDETIYFLITTRFNDGDPGNNYRSADDDHANNPESDPQWRGDFKGLIDKLDYIKALGFTAICMADPAAWSLATAYITPVCYYSIRQIEERLKAESAQD